MGTMALVMTLLAAADGGTDATLQQGMVANMVQVAAVLPYLQDPAAFRDPAHAKQIAAAIDVLSKVKHVVRSQDNAAIGTVATLFEQESRLAGLDFAQGRKDEARGRVIGLTRMCVGCHSRTGAAVDWKGVDGLLDALKLTPLQRATYYVGTHQIERAREIWKRTIINTPIKDTEAFEQAQALRLAVATLTRGQHDPDAVLELVLPQLERRDFPGFFQRSLKRWAADAGAWKAEKYDPAKQPPAKLLAKADALLAKSGAERRVLNDDDHLVLNMRAAAYVQAALDTKLPPAEEARAMYLLALANTSLVEAELWQLDALYPERCVELVPHTPRARACVDRLADRLGFAFHGSAGGPMPAEYVRRIGELRALAAP